MAKNKSAGSLDTNVLLRLLLDDVSSHTQAVETLLAQGKVFEIADAAIIEMIFVLEKVYGFARADVQENTYAIVRHEQFICNKVLFECALPLYVNRDKLSIMDCILLSYARVNNAIPLWTFDRDLAKLSEGAAQTI